MRRDCIPALVSSQAVSLSVQSTAVSSSRSGYPHPASATIKSARTSRIELFTIGLFLACVSHLSSAPPASGDISRASTLCSSIIRCCYPCCSPSPTYMTLSYTDALPTTRHRRITRLGSCPVSSPSTSGDYYTLLFHASLLLSGRRTECGCCPCFLRAFMEVGAWTFDGCASNTGTGGCSVSGRREPLGEYKSLGRRESPAGHRRDDGERNALSTAPLRPVRPVHELQRWLPLAPRVHLPLFFVQKGTRLGFGFFRTSLLVFSRELSSQIVEHIL
ncbi:hypothetical protein C8R45DRAFT_1039741 [Mycena sanguinolenta]|nr:hypothetical protein C8R45DRAFT_1039741 [Mycena sanguinolenta]